MVRRVIFYHLHSNAQDVSSLRLYTTLSIPETNLPFTESNVWARSTATPDINHVKLTVSHWTRSVLESRAADHFVTRAN